jgi:hypothetical protein
MFTYVYGSNIIIIQSTNVCVCGFVLYVNASQVVLFMKSNVLTSVLMAANNASLKP